MKRQLGKNLAELLAHWVARKGWPLYQLKCPAFESIIADRPTTMKPIILSIISLASAFALSNCAGSFSVGESSSGADQGAAMGAAVGSAAGGAAGGAR